MSEAELRQLLDDVRVGARSADEALQHLRSGPFRTTNLGFAQVDHHRRLRQGLGEVIFGEGKTAAQVIAIAAEAGQAGAPVLITRLQPEKSAEVAARFPGARVNAAARTVTLHAPRPPRRGRASRTSWSPPRARATCPSPRRLRRCASRWPSRT